MFLWGRGFMAQAENSTRNHCTPSPKPCAIEFISEVSILTTEAPPPQILQARPLAVMNFFQKPGESKGYY